MKKKKYPIVKLSILCFIAMMATGGCGLVSGAGKDLTRAADWMQDKIDHGFNNDRDNDRLRR